MSVVEAYTSTAKATWLDRTMNAYGSLKLDAGTYTELNKFNPHQYSIFLQDLF
jgi:hypothetical protein